MIYALGIQCNGELLDVLSLVPAEEVASLVIELPIELRGNDQVCKVAVFEGLRPRASI